MSRKRALLVSDPAYRALTLTSRGLLRDLWDLAESSPERGMLRSMPVLGKMGLVALVGAKAHQVREALSELVAYGWLQASTPTASGDPNSIPSRSHLDPNSIRSSTSPSSGSTSGIPSGPTALHARANTVSD